MSSTFLLRGSIFLCLLVSGCGKPAPKLPETLPVQGQILSSSGVPIAKGLIQFESVDNPSLNVSSPIHEGKFELKTAYGNSMLAGVMPGTYFVMVTPAFEVTPVTMKLAKPVIIESGTKQLVLQCDPPSKNQNARPQKGK